MIHVDWVEAELVRIETKDNISYNHLLLFFLLEGKLELRKGRKYMGRMTPKKEELENTSSKGAKKKKKRKKARKDHVQVN